MDFGDISEVVQPLVARLDHRHLGTWRPTYLLYDNFSAVEGLPDGFYPTSENLLWWIGGQLHSLDLYKVEAFQDQPERFVRPVPGQIIDYGGKIPPWCVTHWSKISIEETCTSRATLTRKEFDAKS